MENQKQKQAFDISKLKGYAKVSSDSIVKSIEENRFNHICLTTAPYIPGREVDSVLEIITAECVFGMNIFRDYFASVVDSMGGRSNATQNVLRDARRTVLYELRNEAYFIDADAVISVNLDYSEFSGHGKSMLFVVASGTAVKLKVCSIPSNP